MNLCVHSLFICEQADTREGLVCLTDGFDRLPGPPPTQPALTDSITDACNYDTSLLLYTFRHTKKVTSATFCVCTHRPRIYTVYACICQCTCEGLCACVCVCIACRSVTKGGRQLGLLRRGVCGVRSNKRARNHKGRREWRIQLLSTVAKTLWRTSCKDDGEIEKGH